MNLLVVGLLLLASTTFAQTPEGIDQNIEQSTQSVVSNTAASSGMHPAAVQTDGSKNMKQYRRELRAQGLSRKEYRRAIHERKHAQNIAQHEVRMKRHARYAERHHNTAMHEHHAQRAEHAAAAPSHQQHVRHH